jgi:hypothetical protein
MLPFVPAVLALAVSMPMAARAQTQDAASKLTQAPKVTNIWVIVMENHNWTGNNSRVASGEPDLKGSSLAPYINGTLLKTSAHAERYFNPPGNHPSAPNYIWLEAGTNFGHHSDALPAADNITSDKHLVHLMDKAGISWKAYAEPNYGKSPYQNCPLTSSELDASHVGVVYFADDTSDFNSQSAYCIAHVRPYSQMAKDIANHNVARYNIITPNLCHDGHQGITNCSDTESTNNTKRGDTWLKQNVPLITNSSEFKKGGILFITWDEGEDSGIYRDGPIGMFVLSPFAKGGGHSAYANYIHYDHSSTLKTIEEIFGLQPLLGAAANPATTDLRDLFTNSKLP